MKTENGVVKIGAFIKLSRLNHLGIHTGKRGYITRNDDSLSDFMVKHNHFKKILMEWNKLEWNKLDLNILNSESLTCFEIYVSFQK